MDKEIAILVCGSRTRKSKDKTLYPELVEKHLFGLNLLFKERFKKEWYIIHGSCNNSADEYAGDWAKENGVKVISYPATRGHHLKRNIEMVEKCDEVLAFWDGYSYGTAHTISHAIGIGKNVKVVFFKDD